MALRAAWALLVVATAVLGPQVVYAQGFFQYFFGPEPLPRPRGVPPRFNLYPPYDSSLPQERPETYRTLCVRTCDGYYYPISFSTMRSELARDAGKCTASCGSEARLFYHPNPGGKVEDMVDLTGMGYASLPNAFRYRQSLVSDCACKSQPWSEAEAERHRGYARTEPLPDERRGRATSRSATGDVPGLTRGVVDRALGADGRRPAPRYDLPSPPQRNGYGPGTPFSPKRGSPAGPWR
jgi:hypothetical protein